MYFVVRLNDRLNDRKKKEIVLIFFKTDRKEENDNFFHSQNINLKMGDNKTLKKASKYLFV